MNTFSIPTLIVERLGWVLLHSLWQFALIAVLAAITIRLLRHNSAALRYVVLGVAMIMTVVVPVATWILQPGTFSENPASQSVLELEHERVVEHEDGIDQPIDPENGSNATGVLAADPLNSQPLLATEANEEDPFVGASASNVSAETLPVVSPAPPPEVQIDPAWSERASTLLRPWLAWIVAGWSVGCLLCSLRPLLGWHTLRRLRRVGVSPVSEDVLATLKQASERLGLRRAVRVLHSTLAKVPVVVGYVRPVILLPVSLVTSIPAAQLEAILAHELAHVRRHDFVVNLVQTLVETVFFYHPAVWWLSRRLRTEREHCCDDLVVSALGNRVEYGRALLAIEEMRGRAKLLAIGAADGSLLARVRRILGFQSESSGSRPWPALSLVVLGIVAVFVLSAVSWHSPAEADPPAAAKPLPAEVPDEDKQTDLRTIREPAFRLPGHSNIQCVGYDNNGKELVVVSTYHLATVRRWDLVGKKLISEITLASDKHLRPFRDGTFQLSGDRRRVVGATDEFVGIWDTATGELLKKLAFPTKEGIYDCCIDKLDCTPDLSVIAGNWAMPGRLTLFYDAHVIVWDGASGRVLQTVIDKHGATLNSIDLSTDGQLLTTTNGGGAKVWKTSTGKLLRSFPNDNAGRKHSDPEVSDRYTSHVWSVQFSPDGKQLGVGDILGVRIWDVSSGKLRHQLDAPYRYSHGNATLVFSKDGQLLARTGTWAKDKERTVPIWSTPSGEKLFELNSNPTSGTFSDDNKQFAVGVSDRQMAIAVFQLSGSAADTVQPPPESTKDKMQAGSHYRGKKAKEFIDDWKPVWGEPQLGIQYGIALTTPQRQFRAGERVPLAVFLRNVSDRPQQVDHRPDFFWNPPKVVNADDEPIEFEKVAVLGTAPHYRDKLEPGEAFGPLYVNFGLGANPRPGRQNWAPYFKTPAAGKYKLTHTLSFKVAGPNVKSNETSEKWTRGELMSGKLEFEVVEGGKPKQAVNQLEPESTRKLLKPAFVLPDHLNVMAVGFGSDSKQLVSVATQKAVSIRTWDVAGKKLKREVKLDSDKHGNFFLFGQLRLSEDGRRVAAIVSGQVGVWETATGKLVKMLALPKELAHGSLRGLACTPDLSLVVCGRTPGLSGISPPHAHAIVWDVASGKVLQTVQHDDAIQLQSVALSHDGKWLATGGQEAGTCVWEVSTGKRLLAIPNPNPDRKHPEPEFAEPGVSQVLCLGFSPNGQQLAIGDMLGVKLVDAKSGELQHQLDAPFRLGRSGLVFSKDSQLLARTATDKIVPIWSTRTGKLLAEIPTEAHDGSFSDDGRWFAVGFTDKEKGLAVWRLRDDDATAVQGLGAAAGNVTREQADELAKSTLAQQSISLSDAVRDFNAENKKLGLGIDQPPLTEDEVVAAIKRADRKRDVLSVGEREFAAFKAVAETRRLPKIAYLRAWTSDEPAPFTVIHKWQVQLYMPTPGEGFDGFTIRNMKLKEEQIDPKSVAWGKPDRDGLSLGLFLLPKKDKYQIGERVQLRLFVRNEGKKAVEGMTFWNITWPGTGSFTVTDQTGARVAVRNSQSEEWSGPAWIAGAMGGRLRPGDVHAFHVPFELGIGGDGSNKLVGRIIDARPGQTLKVRVRSHNGSSRKRTDNEPEPESGDLTFRVVEAAS